MIKLIATILLSFSCSAFAVTSESGILERFKVVGVIAASQSSKGKTTGGVAVIKDTATNKTLVVKAGLPIPGYPSLRVIEVGKKAIFISQGGQKIALSSKGFGGFSGEKVASSSRNRYSNFDSSRDSSRKSKAPKPANPFDSQFEDPWSNNGVPPFTGEDMPAPPFPEEIDEMFFEEFGENPFQNSNDNLNQQNMPLTRDELLRKYDFDPEDFSDAELQNMVSPPPMQDGSN